MAETLVKMIVCDRCGKLELLPRVKGGSLYRDFDYTDNIQERPEGWAYHYDTGLLCDECEKEYRKVINAFMEK